MLSEYFETARSGFQFYLTDTTNFFFRRPNTIVPARCISSSPHVHLSILKREGKKKRAYACMYTHARVYTIKVAAKSRARDLQSDRTSGPINGLRGDTFTVRLTAKRNMWQTSFANARNTATLRISHDCAWGSYYRKRAGDLSRRGRESRGRERYRGVGFMIPILYLHIAPYFYTAAVVAYSRNYAQFTARTAIQ